jgi:hypothetical protein
MEAMNQLSVNGWTSFLNGLSTKRGLFILLFGSVACLRLCYCFQLPVNTGDIPRHLFSGLYVAKMGLPAAGHALADLNPALRGVAWAGLPYNYPVVTLLFFTVIAKLWPTLFFVKLALTLIEAVNTALIWKFSNQRWLALLYWASPVSVWWVSHEGQFEPLQTLFACAGLVLLKDRKCLAGALLALAIQVKFTAIFFLPYFVLTVWQDNRKGLPAALAAFCLGFAPTLIAAGYYPVLAQIFSTAKSQAYNPYYWNIFKHDAFGWNPGWLVLFDQCASYGMLLAIGALALRRKGIKGYGAALCFIIFCKFSPLCQFWYFGLFVPFLLPIEDRRQRLWLAALAPLLDLYSPAEMFGGPFGFTMAHYYDGLSVFTRHAI